MATNTRKDSTGARTGSQPSYQYDPWNQDQGGYNSDLSNGEGYQGDSSSLKQSSGRSKAAEQRESATRSLRDAENNALSKREPSYLGGKDNGSLYTGTGKDTRGGNNGKIKGKNPLRGKGALITILMILTGGGIFLSSSNSLLAPAMSSLFTSKTQTSYTAYTMRSKYITRYMMKNNSSGAVTTGFTGKVKYTRIPSRLQSRLAKYNIEIEGSGSNTTLSWTHTTSTGGTETISGITADDFLDMYNNNTAFREDYINARYGRAATFYDKVADKIYQKLGISRNLQASYKQTGDAEVDAENYDKTLRPKFDGDEVSLETSVRGEHEETQTTQGADGKTHTEKVIVEDSSPTTADGSSKTSSASAADATSSARSMIAGFANTVGKVGSAVCTTLKIGSMIGIAASAQEKYQAINFAMASMENVSKMMAGAGDESGINTFLNYMSTTETTDVQDYNPSNFTGLSTISSFLSDFNNDSDPPAIEAKMTTETGSPLEASGIQSLLGDAPVTSASTQNYSRERILKSLGGSAIFGAGTALTCAGVSILSSIVSLAVTISPAGLVKIASSFLTGFIHQFIASAAAGAFFAFLVPTLASVFFRNVIDTAIGIPGGQFLAGGIADSNMSAARGSGLSISSANATAAYNRANNVILAQEAEQDRYRLSPFDTTNPNTFFGSIAYSLLPTLTSPNVTSLASFLRSTSSSLSSLIGKVSAEGEGSSYITTYGDCPLLDEVGAVGDMYCNPITSMDMSLIETDPDDTTYNNVLMQAGEGSTVENLTCDTNGNCTIQEGSNLAKYISYCDNRESPFGAVDQNILSQEGFTTSTFLNSIPIVGDVINIADSVDQMFGDSINWANGTRCGNTEANSDFWNSEGRYYQMYIQDQRILEQMGAYEGEQNPVLAYEEAHEEKYPTDNSSYIAYLSRISGLTLENTETVLAYVAYYTYIDNYDPSVRIAAADMLTTLGGEAALADIAGEHQIFEEDDLVDNPLETTSNPREYIIYNDVRNRSFAV